MQVYEQFSEQLVNWVQNIALPHLVTMMTGRRYDGFGRR